MSRDFSGKIKQFVQKEAVLCAAVALAVVSACVVGVDRAYLEYLDYRTLAILFCLMCVMAGLQKIGVFGRVAGLLLSRVRGAGAIAGILVFLCFFFSMAITNDVALITFVPFTFIVLKMLPEEQQKRLCLPVVVLQTIAANLGSMLTPIGNPQNLYLYGKAGISPARFLWLMLPYTLLAGGLLLVCCVWLSRGKKPGEGNAEAGKSGKGCGDAENSDAAGAVVANSGTPDAGGAKPGEGCVDAENSDAVGAVVANSGTPDAGAVKPGVTYFGAEKSSGADRFRVWLYLILFGVCLLAVARILPCPVMFVIVVVAVSLADRRVFAKVDYSLLLTFVGFFVFIGNMGRIPAFCDFLEKVLTGREVLTAVVASQVISNVPAALLLSGFTQDYEALIVGTNLGGLGTLIASMASLISYKYVAVQYPERKGAYFGLFTLANIAFLAAELLLWMLAG